MTALSFLRIETTELLLVGEGPLLRIYDVRACSIVRSVNLFVSEPIQGIKSRTPSEKGAAALVWAGRLICLVELDCYLHEGQVSIHVVSRIEGRADDRILDACLVNCIDDHQYNSPFNALLLTSHNDILSFQPGGRLQKASQPAKICYLTSGPRSLLCSAQLVFSHDGLGLVAAGTAFGEIFFWTFPVDRLQKPASSTIQSQLYHTFSGHEGSVFGVSISELDPLPEFPATQRFLASCSDDRTICIHGLPDTSSNASHQRGQSISSGSKNNRPLAVATGHNSRIWGVRFLGNTKQSWYLLSNGEDSTAQIWRFSATESAELSSREASSHLGHTLTYKHHFGKNLWAVAVSRKADSMLQISTGGADGRIAIYDLGDLEHYPSSSAWWKQYGMEEISQDLSLNTSELSPGSFEAVSAQSAVMRLFTALRGEWTLQRGLDSLIPTYPSGTLRGTASFEERPPTDQAYDMEYLYTETGELMTKQGFKLAASRRYVYRYRKSIDQITAWFVKPEDGSSVDYLFHTLSFDRLPESEHTGAFLAKGYHLCVEDDYNANYRFEIPNVGSQEWQLRYVVTGPNKDYISDSLYSRKTSGDISIDSSNEAVALNKAPQLGSKIHSEFGQLNAEAWKTYAWINEDSVLATTEHGQLLLGSLASNQSPRPSWSLSWSKIAGLSDFKGTSVLSIAGNTETAFLSGSNGTVYLYKHRTCTSIKITKLPGKVAFMQASQRMVHPIVGAQCEQTPEFLVFASCIGSSIAHCLLVQLTEEASECVQVDLELPTSFITTSSRYIAWEDLLILGSRSGSVAIYSVDMSKAVTSQAVHRLSIRLVHGSEAVTTIIALPVNSPSSDANSCHIISAGRNGTYAVHRLTKNELYKHELKIDFSTLHVGALPFGPNIEGGIFHQTSKELILWGFRSKEFVVWSESRKMEIMDVECGGSHRNWAYVPRSDGLGGGNFIWTKASLLNICIQPQASHRVVQFGAHGREIKALAVSPAIVYDAGVPLRILVSGAEDTTIRVFKFHANHQRTEESFQCLHVLEKHTTGIRRLQWSPNGHFLFSAGGREELFVWRVQQVPYFTIGVVCDSACPTVTESAELRIMGFDMLQDNGHSTLETYILFIVYSDSSIRVRMQPYFV